MLKTVCAEWELVEVWMRTSTGIQQPSARPCFLIAEMLCFEVTAIVSVTLPRTRLSEPLVLFWHVPGTNLWQRPSLALIHPKHAKPSHSPISITWKWRGPPNSGSGCCHNLLHMSRRTPSFSFVPQQILTLHIPLLTSRWEAGLLFITMCIMDILVATRAFHITYLPVLPFAILYMLQKSNRMWRQTFHAYFHLHATGLSMRLNIIVPYITVANC